MYQTIQLPAEHDADATAQDTSESTPMILSHSVVQEESVDHTRLLVEHGTDATAPDADEAIPLRSSSQEEVQILCTSPSRKARTKQPRINLS